MLSAKWSRVVVGAMAGAAMVGAAGYRRKVSAMPKHRRPHRKASAREEAFKPAYNKPPSNYRGPLFEPRFDFPTSLPREDYRGLPWMSIDFKKNSEAYMNAVIDYCFEGNPECDFRMQHNKVRPWYSAPWLSSRPLGREPIHGLTLERPVDPGYLGPKSTNKRWVQTWSVGFYNSFGGYTIGQFWKDPGNPAQTKNVKFPDGTVAFKLLFTQSTVEEVPALEGAKVWQAAIAIPSSPIPPTESGGRVRDILNKTMEPRDRGPNPYQLRLIQVDVMVRDPRSEIGWVFGSYMYDKDQPNPAHPREDEWRKLVPMALQWGNDPNLTPEAYYDQAQKPTESWTNPRVKELKLLPKGRPYLGYLERANGIVDIFISSCASCHSTASIPAPKLAPKPDADTFPDMTPDTMNWFRNIKGGEEHFAPGMLSLDFSLQLATGLRGFKMWQGSKGK